MLTMPLFCGSLRGESVRGYLVDFRTLGKKEGGVIGVRLVVGE